MTEQTYKWYATAERDRIRLFKCKGEGEVAGLETSETPEEALMTLEDWLEDRRDEAWKGHRYSNRLKKLIAEAEEEEHGRPVDPGEVPT